MKTIGQVLRNRPRSAIKCNVRHPPVIDIGKGIVGLVSTRDPIREKFALRLQ